MNKISEQFEYLQPEKPSGFENEMSSKKHLQSIYSRVWQKGPPPGSDRVKYFLNSESIVSKCE